MKNLIMTTLGFILSSQIALAGIAEIKYKAEGLANLIQGISGVYIVNYDISSLDNIVKAAKNDKDINFLQFFDNNSKPLTETSLPKETAGILVLERKINGVDGKLVGTMKIGFNKAAGKN